MNYELTRQAELDLEEIFDFGVYQFGFHQADKYLERLAVSIETISENPGIGKSRNDLYTELRSLIVGSHTIFYEIQLDHILIVRVLHHSRDVEQYF